MAHKMEDHKQPLKIEEKHQPPLKISVQTPMEMDNRMKSKSSSNGSPKLRPAMTKASSGRWNCLCSPTTHAGSFRCRFHRSPAPAMIRGGSVGSNLSDLAAKSRSISDLV